MSHIEKKYVLLFTVLPSLSWQKPEEFLKLFQNWRIPSFCVTVPAKGLVLLPPHVSAGLIWPSNLSFLETSLGFPGSHCPVMQKYSVSVGQFVDLLILISFQCWGSAAWLEWSIPGWGLRCEITSAQRFLWCTNVCQPLSAFHTHLSIFIRCAGSYHFLISSL